MPKSNKPKELFNEICENSLLLDMVGEPYVILNSSNSLTRLARDVNRGRQFRDLQDRGISSEEIAFYTDRVVEDIERSVNVSRRYVDKLPEEEFLERLEAGE